MKRIIYIAGPVTNNKHYKSNFKGAESRLRGRFPDCVILNPSIFPNGLQHAEYMQICKPMVEISTHVYFLRGWEKSKGANIEYRWAKKYNKEIEYEQIKQYYE